MRCTFCLSHYFPRFLPRPPLPSANTVSFFRGRLSFRLSSFPNPIIEPGKVGLYRSVCSDRVTKAESVVWKKHMTDSWNDSGRIEVLCFLLFLASTEEESSSLLYLYSIQRNLGEWGGEGNYQRTTPNEIQTHGWGNEILRLAEFRICHAFLSLSLFPIFCGPFFARLRSEESSFFSSSSTRRNETD